MSWVSPGSQSGPALSSRGGDQSQGSLNLRIPFFPQIIFSLLTAGLWTSGPWLRCRREAASPDPPRGPRTSHLPPQVLETCMKSCGKRFHDEVGKFRFLNELIKVVSPKVGVSTICSDLCCHGGLSSEDPRSREEGDCPPPDLAQTQTLCRGSSHS